MPGAAEAPSNLPKRLSGGLDFLTPAQVNDKGILPGAWDSLVDLASTPSAL